LTVPDQFEDILREAVLTPETVDVDALRVAVRPAGAKIKLPLVLDLVRLAHHRPPSSEGDEAFRKALNAKEPVIQDSGQAQLLSILATSTLINAFSLNANADLGVNAAAMAVRCVRLAGWTPAHVDLGPHADRWLDFRARAARVLPALPGRPADLPAPEGLNAADQSIPAINTALDAVSSEMVNRGRQALDGLGSLSTAVAARERIAEEQQSLLWWLASAWAVSDPTLMAITAASELSSLTRLLPGPFAIEELLRRKLGTSFKKPVEIATLGERAATVALPGLSLDIPLTATEFFPLFAILRGGDPTLIEPLELAAGIVARSLYDEAMLAYSVRTMA
jgi:hypothetical protein